MKNATNKAFSLILLIVIVFTATNAMALTMRYDAECFNRLPHCNIYTPQELDFTNGKPVLIFFPGSKECTSIRQVVGFMRKYNLYENIDVNLIGVAFKTKGYDHKGWQKISQDMVDLLKDEYEKNHFDIIIDCVSFGGYAGIYLTELFRKNGIIVKELNLADAVVQNIVNIDWVKEQVEGGTQVNVYACDQYNASISVQSRQTVKELSGIDHFYGEIVADSTHGNVLGKAINERGLHSEYRTDKGTGHTGDTK